MSFKPSKDAPPCGDCMLEDMGHDVPSCDSPPVDDPKSESSHSSSKEPEPAELEAAEPATAASSDSTGVLPAEVESPPSSPPHGSH